MRFEPGHHCKFAPVIIVVCGLGPFVRDRQAIAELPCPLVTLTTPIVSWISTTTPFIKVFSWQEMSVRRLHVLKFALTIFLAAHWVWTTHHSPESPPLQLCMQQ